MHSSTISAAARALPSSAALRPISSRAAGLPASRLMIPERRSPERSLSGIISAAPLLTRSSAFFVWWSFTAWGNGMKTAALPLAVISAIDVAPARQMSRSASP